MQKLTTKMQDIKSINEIGIFTGYASVFNNVDSHNDIVLPGAFKNGMANRVQLLWQHDQKIIIGKILELSETVKGLFMKAQLYLDVTQGKEAYTLMKDGVLDGLSIGFEVEDYFYNDDKRYIKSAKLWEISLVTFPSNERARIIEMKNSQELIDLKNALERANKALTNARS